MKIYRIGCDFHLIFHDTKGYCYCCCSSTIKKIKQLRINKDFYSHLEFLDTIFFHVALKQPFFEFTALRIFSKFLETRILKCRKHLNCVKHNESGNLTA